MNYLNYKKMPYSISLLLYLTGLLFVAQVQAQQPIDHVLTTQKDNIETTEIFFNTPVQYLYHTPRDNTDNALIGIYINKQNSRSNTINSSIPFGRSAFISDMEFFNEPGFNPHIYVQFNSTVDLTIQPGKKLRSLILTIKKHK